MDGGQEPRRVGLGTIAREWGRIGCTGFGGPPTHIALLRRLCVERRDWIAAQEFEDGIEPADLLVVRPPSAATAASTAGWCRRCSPRSPAGCRWWWR
ncbi:chromate transporter, partial [Kitasatospora cystarginea]|uniref:chromate transporter n=1 Tax=Kitasatospora cystarginea TaxID=58350 RepID=UPI0031DFBA8F